jgi:hypothetical protein
MEKGTARELTDEEKQKVIFVVSDIIQMDMPEEPTEYDVFMRQKTEEFISCLLQKDDPEEIDALLEMCEEYIKENGQSLYALGLIMMYDMWLNKSCVWPVMHNPEWAEWEKLKEKKVNPPT